MMKPFSVVISTDALRARSWWEAFAGGGGRPQDCATNLILSIASAVRKKAAMSLSAPEQLFTNTPRTITNSIFIAYRRSRMDSKKSSSA
jgi:hypothetical protein